MARQRDAKYEIAVKRHGGYIEILQHSMGSNSRYFRTKEWRSDEESIFEQWISYEFSRTK